MTYTAFTKWILVLGLLLCATTSFAACEVDGIKLKVGEALFVEDKLLIEQLKTQGKKVSPDWTGFVVECKNSVTLSPHAVRPGDIIKVVEPVLILTEISSEYHTHVQEYFSQRQ